jgi:hypothetical protein
MIGLYFGGQWFQTKFGNQYGNIELDAALDESHEWSVEVTSNPVEVGAPVSDHVIDQSDKLKIKGFVTDTPLTTSQSIAQISRSQGVFDLLYQLLKLKEPMTVYTKHKIYVDMVLTNVVIPRAAGIGEAIEFSAEFINLRKVATQMVDIPKGINAKKDKKSDAATGRKTEPQKDGGNKQAQTVTKPSSTLSRILK